MHVTPSYFDTWSQVFLAIEESQNQELVKDLVLQAVKYAQIRADYALATTEDRAAMETRRTHTHNAFIDACNILSRAMAASGESVEWRRTLGEDRKRIGDFACVIHCLLAIGAR